MWYNRGRRFFYPFCETMRSYSPVAYTLVELLVALALSLLLLLGVVELLSRVGGTMNDTRAAMGASANLHEAAILLRQDLARIPDTLATKPLRIADASEKEISDNDGYLEIIEGPYGVLSHPYVDSSRNNAPDPTVGDVDDIIAFTAFAEHTRFRGLVLNENQVYSIEETDIAEIVWFVRGNTLYRRVRLIKDDTPVSERADRKFRLLHAFEDNSGDSVVNSFPYPLYDIDNHPDWRYLRVPTLEETLHKNWTSGQWKTITFDSTGFTENPDLWEQPHFFPNSQDSHSGSLKQFVDNPRKSRAGEDVVLTNVLSFDVKVWCPETGDFVDLGTADSVWVDNNNQPILNVNQPNSPRTWDSWTQNGEYADKLPPYPTKELIDEVTRLEAELANTPDDEQKLEEAKDKLKQAQEQLVRFGRLEAVQITIRCFDPASRVIKQVTVEHQFNN